MQINLVCSPVTQRQHHRAPRQKKGSTFRAVGPFICSRYISVCVNDLSDWNAALFRRLLATTLE